MISSSLRTVVGLSLTLFLCGAAVAAVPSGDGVVVGTASSMVNIFPDEAPVAGTLRKSIEIESARRERQSAQIVIGAGATPVQIDRISVSDLAGVNSKISSKNVDSHIVAFTNVKNSTWRGVKRIGYWPDPLIRFRPFDCPAGQFRSVWVTVNVPEKAKAGDYSGRITLLFKNKEIAIVPIKLHVYDFTLPRIPHLNTSYWSALGDRYDVSKEPKALDNMIQLYGDYRTSTNFWYGDPVKWYREKDGIITCDISEMKKLITKIDAANSRTFQIGSGCWPRTNFAQAKIVDRITGKPLAPEENAKYVGDALAKLYMNQMCDWLVSKGWLDRAYMQVHDESFDPDGSQGGKDGASWTAIREFYTIYRKLEPRLNYLGLTGIHPDMQETYDIWSPLMPYSDVKCNEMILNGISLRGPKNFVAQVTASSCGGGSTLYWTRPIDSYDGCDYTKWNPSKSPEEGKSEWLKYDFNKVEEIDGIRIVPFVAPHYTGKLSGLTVEGSIDGLEFAPLDLKPRLNAAEVEAESYSFRLDNYKAIRLTWNKSESTFLPNNDQPAEAPIWKTHSPLGVREVEFLKTGLPLEASLPRKKVKPVIMWEYQVDADYPGVCIDADPAEIRNTGWLCWQRGLAGYLNYGGGQWNEVPFPPGIKRAKDEDPIFWSEICVNGGPCITYPGKDEVLPSVRFARFRDGLQDYDYLMMLKSLDPDNALLKSIKNSGRDYFSNANQIASTRRELAKELESASRKQDR